MKKMVSIILVLLFNCSTLAMEKPEKEDNEKDKEKIEYYSDSDADFENQNYYIKPGISFSKQAPVITSPTNYVAQPEKSKKQTSFNSPNSRWKGHGKSKLSQEISYYDLQDALDEDQRSMGISIEDELFDQKPDLAAGVQLTGKTPHFINPQILIDEAILAIISGDKKSMEMLLAQGLNPYSITAENISLLQAARNSGQWEIVETLEKTCTTFEKQSGAGFIFNSAQAYSREQKNSNVMQLKPAEQTNKIINTMLEDVIKFIKENKVDDFRSFLRHINIKNLDKHAQTPLLITAVKSSSPAIVKLLLERGLSVNCSNDEGWTPLMEAVLEEREEMVDLLLQNGADVNAQDYTECTALDLVDNCTNESIKALLNEAKVFCDEV